MIKAAWRVLLCAALICCMMLSGCTVDPAVTTTNNGDAGTIPGGNTAVGTHNGNYGLELSGNDGWAVVSNSQLYGAVVEDGYYYWDDGFLRYLDMNTGVSVYLCSKVACEHKDDACEASIPDITAQQLMFWWDEGLYYIESDGSSASLLLRRDSAGMAMEKIARLGETLMGPERVVRACQFVVADGWMYYLVETDIMSQLPDGGIATKGDKCYLCRVNLKSGKDEILVEFDGGYLELVTARSDAMLYVVCDTPELEYNDKGVPVFPDGYYEELASSPANLMRWDESTGESTVLLERTNDTLYAAKSYGGKVVFVDSDNVNRYAYDLKTGEVSELDIIKGSIINETYMLHAESGRQTIKNMQTGKNYPVELYGKYIRLYNLSDKWLILTLVKDDSSRESYYISMSAIGDGIQAAEAIPFPS